MLSDLSRKVIRARAALAAIVCKVVRDISPAFLIFTVAVVEPAVVAAVIALLVAVFAAACVTVCGMFAGAVGCEGMKPPPEPPPVGVLYPHVEQVAPDVFGEQVCVTVQPVRLHSCVPLFLLVPKSCPNAVVGRVSS